jgi:hypothetical protein
MRNARVVYRNNKEAQQRRNMKPNCSIISNGDRRL